MRNKIAILGMGYVGFPLLQSFSNHKIDILIGTQMIAKGLDFPNVTLVGIINADLGLHIPDFRSSERIFQLIYQAAGRSGRSQKQGEVVIQTYDKENHVINAASKLNLKDYYNNMLTDRNTLNYPPYSWVSKVDQKHFLWTMEAPFSS